MRTKYIFKSNSFLISWFSNISALFTGCLQKEILSQQRIRYIFRLRSTVGIITSYSYTWAQFGGDAGDVSPHFFRRGGHNMPCPPTFFSRFCISRGFKKKSDACHVLCEELFMLDGRPHIARLMLKQFGVVSLISVSL